MATIYKTKFKTISTIDASQYAWLFSDPVIFPIIDQLLNRQFVKRNNVWEVFGLPATANGCDIIADAETFFATLKMADDMCHKIYGMSLKEKCEKDDYR